VDTVYALKDQVKGLACQLSSIATRMDSEVGQRTALQAAVNSLLLASGSTSTTNSIKESITADSPKKDALPNA
jgi:hypothetical protein